MEELWGSTLDNYVEEKHTKLGTCWFWKDPSNLEIPDELKTKLTSIF